jgi:hypothetical protein
MFNSVFIKVNSQSFAPLYSPQEGRHIRARARTHTRARARTHARTCRLHWIEAVWPEGAVRTSWST